MQRAYAFAALALTIAAAVPAAKADETHRTRNIEITGAWVRASLGTVPTTAGYMTIKSADGRPDRLIAASSPAAEKVELHTHILKDGVAMMREVPAIDVPGAAIVELKAGGYHLMFLKVKAPIKEGDKVPVTLTFERAGQVTFTAPAKRQGAGHRH